jgi:putative transposase
VERTQCSHEQNKSIMADTDYIYRLFFDQKREARKRYRAFVAEDIFAGKRPDLTDGGLLRSSGGWTGLKRIRKSGLRIKGDERILGDSDFVEYILKSAEETLEEKYDLKVRGYDFDRAVERTAEVMGMTPDQVTAFGKSPQTVNSRSVLCFWAHRKLGMSTVEIANKLKMSQPAVSRSSRRGEKIGRENKFEFIAEKRIKI